jgi:hypothetical protein
LARVINPAAFIVGLIFTQIPALLACSEYRPLWKGRNGKQALTIICHFDGFADYHPEITSLLFASVKKRRLPYFAALLPEKTIT